LDGAEVGWFYMVLLGGFVRFLVIFSLVKVRFCWMAELPMYA